MTHRSRRAARPTSYDELINLLEDLPAIVRHARRQKGQSLREAGRSAGLSFTTIARVESGDYEMDTGTMKSLLLWASS